MDLYRYERVNYWLVLLSIAFSLTLLIFAFISSCTYTSYSHSQGSRVVDSLEFVIVVSRHGNRAPLGDFPGNPYPSNNTQYWPYGPGGLTPHGRIQMYNLGLKIRSMYDGFLQRRYDSNDFFASTTAIERSMLSGEAFLNGLYPPTNENQLWERIFPFQLIPLYSNSTDKTLVTDFCVKAHTIRESATTQFIEEEKDLVTKVFQYLNTSNFIDLFALFDTILVESIEGFTLPPWIENMFPHPSLELLTNLSIAYTSGTNELANIIIGDFYRELFGLLERKINGSLIPNRKMYYYSAHDHSLMALQAILGIPKKSITLAWPGAALIFELHRHNNSKEFSIQVLYIDGNSTDLKPRHLPIPNCEPSCSFSTIIETTQEFINGKTFDEECVV